MKEIGSLWRKWDLHLHTASSYDYQYKASDADNVLIQSLNENQISAVAITDHFIIDEDRILNLRKLASEIVFFPGVELRTDKGDTNIHIVLIFNDKINLHSLCEGFNVFRRDKGKCIDNNERIYWDYNDIINFAQGYEALVSIHAGRKSNGVDEKISNALPHNQAVKEEFAKTIDVFEMGQERDLAEYRKCVFPSTGIKPMIICSDNHDPRNYSSSLWIKADLTFNGLKQIINEPERVSIKKPDLLSRIESNPLKFIKKLSVNKKSNSTISDIWYDNVNIDINPGLVAIIGNKGSGKSAIADIIGLCADTHNDNWSFLTPYKFRKTKPFNLSQHFEAQIVWKDNSVSTLKSLDDSIDKNQPERVKYIPQNFLENICTTENDKDFENEMKSIIFQYLPEAQRYGKQSLDDVLNYLSQEILDSETEIKSRLNNQNQDIVKLEEKQSPDYKLKLESTLKLKKDELENLKNIKPQEIQKPDHSDSEEEQKIKEQIEELQSQIKQNDADILSAQNELNEATKKIQDLTSLKERLERFYVAYQNMKDELKSVCEENVLNIDTIIKVTCDVNIIDSKLQMLKLSVDKCSKLLSQEEECGLIAKGKKFAKKLRALEDKLSEPDKLYQKYLADLKQWEIKVNHIQGNAETNGTILFYEAQLRYLDDQLMSDLVAAKETRENTVLELIRKKREILNTYTTLYKPISEFIENFKEELKSYPIELNASFIFDNIEVLFFDKINQQVMGSFCGKEQGLLRLKELCEKVDLEKDDSIYNFVSSLNEMLLCDKRETYNGATRNVDTQLKKGYTTAQLYDFIYGLEYIKPLFKLKLSGKDLSALSPGERGALLLLFYLFVDMDDKPLVIDQPEENLDNESVYDYLVTFIKKAKNKRQIIMVTHNPNLAVVCDADQIIKMNIDKEHGNRVSFMSGAIENQAINKCIVDILEGTYPAFRNRDNKYLNNLA